MTRQKIYDALTGAEAGCRKVVYPPFIPFHQPATLGLETFAQTLSESGAIERQVFSMLSGPFLFSAKKARAKEGSFSTSLSWTNIVCPHKEAYYHVPLDPKFHEFYGSHLDTQVASGPSVRAQHASGVFTRLTTVFVSRS